MFAVLHISNFALQAVLRTEREATARPAALFTENTKKSLIIEANSAARAHGVESGMTAPQAVARCPTLLIRTPNVAAETEARASLLAVGFTLSPVIEDTAPGVCTIDLKGATDAHTQRAASAAVAQLAELGLQAAAGIAATPLLALYAARCGAKSTPPAPQPPHVADAAAPYGLNEPSLFDAQGQLENNKPSAIGGHRSAVFAVADARAFLAPLPLSIAEPSPQIADILASWGIRTLGRLTTLSRDDIGRRLGVEGAALWDRASGGTVRPLNPIIPAQTFSAAMEFEEEIETLEPLLFILRRFVDRLSMELRTASFVAAALDLSLMLANDTRHDRLFRLPEPTADPGILFRALHTHLESLHTPEAITGVQLRATPARPLVRQQGLFDTGLRDPHGFAETLARIAAIVGPDRVGTPQREDTHRPDAVKLVPPPATIPAPATALIHPPLGLPLRRFRPWLRAQLELTEGRPTYLWTERFNGTVTDVRGPWLSSGEWWQADRSWRRTEYDVALAEGGLYRLVYAGQSWYVEGEYD